MEKWAYRRELMVTAPPRAMPRTHPAHRGTLICPTFGVAFQVCIWAALCKMETQQLKETCILDGSAFFFMKIAISH